MKPSDMHIKYAQMHKLRWGVPYPSPIASQKAGEEIFSNKARVNRLVAQWNRWCEGDFSKEITEG